MIHQNESPQNIRTRNHRKRLMKWWASKAWKEYVRVHTLGKVCSECGAHQGEVINGRKPATLTVNHLYRDVYNSFEEYLKFTDGVTTVTCNTCNWMYEKGKNCCPRCKRYKYFNQPICSSCYKQDHPEIEVARLKKKTEAKALQKRLRDAEKARVKQWKLEHK